MAAESTWTDCSLLGSGVEELGMMFDVIAHEGVDEKVAVVVALHQETQLASRSCYNFNVYAFILTV